PQAARPLGGRRRAASLRGEPFRFLVRVYYEDTDAAGVVYYANYLKYMERARTEWLEAFGHPLAAFEREHNLVFVVHRCEIDYRRPARLNDLLEVTVEAETVGGSRFVAVQRVERGGEVLTDARVSLACLDAKRWRPMRIPASLLQRLESNT
ncbi:MAG: tol-pal system-associated acyl-CoA thioesterase, partial [Casimicrobiaceae bacterium]